jgi:hypothetical protein
VERRLFDVRMADGSRNFADLPETYGRFATLLEPAAG